MKIAVSDSKSFLITGNKPCRPCSQVNFIRRPPRALSASMSTNRGIFVVFEGMDRSGKSTQSKKLHDTLEKNGHDVELWSFPDRSTETGKLIDSYLKGDLELDSIAVHLLFSANRWERRNELIKKLQSGCIVIADRYAYSGVVYTAAKGVESFDLNWCKLCDSGLPAPDIVLFLDMSPDDIAKRGGFGTERYEKIQFQSKVRGLFKDLSICVNSWHTILADSDVNLIEKEVYNLVQGVLTSCQSTKTTLRTLWGQ